MYTCQVLSGALQCTLAKYCQELYNVHLPSIIRSFIMYTCQVLSGADSGYRAVEGRCIAGMVVRLPLRAWIPSRVFMVFCVGSGPLRRADHSFRGVLSGVCVCECVCVSVCVSNCVCVWCMCVWCVCVCECVSMCEYVSVCVSM
jgi:hypothetical protein